LAFREREEENVNRPFGALGALAAMLALAMLAVSSSSRSTTVGSGPANRLRGQRTPSRGSYLTATERPWAPPGVDSTHPFAAAAPADEDDECVDLDCDYSPASDLNHWSCEFAATHAVATTPSDDSVKLPLSLAEPGGLKPVQLEAVEPVALQAAATPSIDCRAWYDAAYDELIYGVSRVGERSTKATAVSDASGLDSVEVIELFRAIFRALGPETGTNAGRRKVPFGADSQAFPSPVSWTEYGELMDIAVTGADLGSPSSAANVRETDVRSGRGLLHSAAAAANRLGQLLNWAATRIDDSVISSTIATSAAARQ
jgi:hypothetical protein